MYRDSIAQFQSSLARKLERNDSITRKLEQARTELAELGNPYARRANDWVDAHLRHLAIQRYHALRELVATLERLRDCVVCGGNGYVETAGVGYYSESHGNWLPDERQMRCPHCGGSGKEVA